MTSSPPPGIAAELQRIISTTRRPGLLAAYLFGSHAMGRAHRESDVDVGILLDRSRHSTSRARFDERVRLSAWLSGALGQRAVDVVVLDDAPPLLARRIVNEGQRLFCADEAADHAFRTGLWHSSGIYRCTTTRLSSSPRSCVGSSRTPSPNQKKIRNHRWPQMATDEHC